MFVYYLAKIISQSHTIVECSHYNYIVHSQKCIRSRLLVGIGYDCIPRPLSSQINCTSALANLVARMNESPASFQNLSDELQQKKTVGAGIAGKAVC